MCTIPVAASSAGRGLARCGTAWARHGMHALSCHDLPVFARSLRSPTVAPWWRGPQGWGRVAGGWGRGAGGAGPVPGAAGTRSGVAWQRQQPVICSWPVFA